MGDPVTMAVVGGTVGAAMNRKDPLKGAMMGAVGGYAGGALMPAAAGGGAMGANAMIPGVQGGMGTLAGQTTALTGSSGGMFGGLSGAGQSLFGQGGTLSQAGQAASVYNQFNQALNPPQPQMQMPGGSPIQRGQVAPMDYMSLLNPQQQNVLRPAPISLL